jgi:chitin disaccharide deacetylase
MPRLILCADDYALAPGVSRTILRLVAAHRLTAVSCITASPYWPEHAAWLRPQAGTADIGLHVALTGLKPLGPMPRLCGDGPFPSQQSLMARAFARLLDRREIEVEIARQIDAFEAAFGRLPAFIDGHLHGHQLPMIRDAVISQWKRRLQRQQAWLRICDEPLSAIWKRRPVPFKASIISALGRGLRRRARAAGIPANDRFAGVHDFSRRVPYPVLFERFLHGAEALPPGRRLLVMCHPGSVDPELQALDPVTDAREDEARFFDSTEFPASLKRHGLTLTRFAQTGRAI